MVSLSVQDERSHLLSEEDDKQTLRLLVRLDKIFGEAGESADLTLQWKRANFWSIKVIWIFRLDISCMNFKSYHQYDSFSFCTRSLLFFGQS